MPAVRSDKSFVCRRISSIFSPLCCKAAKVSVAAKITVNNLPLEKLIPELQSLAEIHGLATGEISFTIDSEAGFTFAKLDLTQLTLTLSSTDENGRPQRLIVKSPCGAA